MSAIEWQSSFETYIEEIDSGNRKIIALINQLEKNAYVRNTQAEAQEVLVQLVKIVIPQFAIEEQLMAENQYDKIDFHADLHQGFLTKMAEYLKRLKSGGSVPVLDFLSYLKSWLINHILRVDTKLRMYSAPKYQI